MNKPENLPDYIEIYPSKLGEEFPTIKYKNRFIHSKYNPIKQIQNDIKRYPNINNSKLILIIGVGYGYILNEIEKNINSKILIIEKEKFFKKFLSRDFLNKNNYKFFWGESKDTIIKYLQDNFFSYDIKDITIIENNALTDIDKEYYNDIKKGILKFFKMQTADITTTAYFSDIWLKNIFINFKHLKKISFISEYKNVFKDKNILFLSASPFLEKQISVIKNFKGFIFALAPAVNFLIKNNIKPDFVISTDANYYNLLHLYKYRNLNLITELSVHPSILSNWNGDIIIIDFNLPPTEIIKKSIGEIGFIPQGGTVASTALYIFKYFGVKNIFTFGQDFLCYGFKSHCRGSGYDKFFLLKNNKFNKIINQNFLHLYNNKLIYKNNFNTTDSKLIMYKEWFNKIIQEQKLNVLDNFIEFNYSKKTDIKTTYKKKELKNFFLFLEKIYKNILNINIDKYSEFGKLISDIKKDLLIYNLFSMLMYKELMKYTRKMESDIYYLTKFKESKKILVNLLEHLIKDKTC